MAHSNVGFIFFSPPKYNLILIVEMENKEKFELAKKYFKEEVERLVSYYNYWNRYSYNIFRAGTVKDAIGDESLATQEIPGSLYTKALINYSFNQRICFGKYTGVLLSRQCHGPEFRSRFFWTPYVKPYNPECANFTWMTKELLEEHVNYPKKLLGIDYDVVVYDAHHDSGSNGPHWDIIFDFKELYRVDIKFILFWSRYATEFPSCFALLDAIMLKDVFPDEEIYNLLTMAARFHRSHFQGFCSISEGQCLSIYGKFVSRKHLLEEIEKNRNFNNDSILKLFGRDSSCFNIVGGWFDKNFDDFDKMLSRDIPKLSFRKENNLDLDLDKFFDEEEIKTRLHWYKDVLYPFYDKERIN
jgi:hypothetical protein